MDGINTGEGCSVGGVNDDIRRLMADIGKDAPKSEGMCTDILSREVVDLIEKHAGIGFSGLVITRTSCMGKNGWDVEVRYRRALYPEPA